jgi:hypothetical protein
LFPCAAGCLAQNADYDPGEKFHLYGDLSANPSHE